MARPITDLERTLIARMIERLPTDQQASLMNDLALATAEPLNDDDSIIELMIEGYQRPRLSGRNVLPVDGIVKDADGAHIELILFSDENDRLFEFEIVRYGDGSVIGPDWGALEFR